MESRICLVSSTDSKDVFLYRRTRLITPHIQVKSNASFFTCLEKTYFYPITKVDKLHDNILCLNDFC